MLSVIDGARATDNLWGERWAKLSQNAMSNPLQALSGLGSLEVASSEVGRTLMIRLAAESARVGLALGHRVPAFGGRARRAVGGRRPARDLGRARPDADARRPPPARNWRASMAQDVAKGRRTEIDEMNGHVVAQGRWLASPRRSRPRSWTPCARSKRAPPQSPQNLELVLRRADP